MVERGREEVGRRKERKKVSQRRWSVEETKNERELEDGTGQEMEGKEGTYTGAEGSFKLMT